MLLLTGCAGFIGFHVAKQQLENADVEIIGVDNLNDYYDPNLKTARLAQLQTHSNFTFVELDLADREQTAQLFVDYPITKVIHLAAQPGVRYSITHPMAYIDSNINGFITVLEAARQAKVKHFVFASTSSVYGANTNQPYSESDVTDHPLALYAATKKANEAMAHSYAHLFDLPCTGLRFFTVYGPWGRPDMAPMLFTKAILNDEPINVFNDGNMMRDFTYVGDIATGINQVLQHPAQPNANWDSDNPDSGSSKAPYRIYNIGNSQPVQLMDFIYTLEEKLGKKAIINFKPLADGDMISTYADTTRLHNDVNYKPNTPLNIGIGHFVDWYRKFYCV